MHFVIYGPAARAILNFVHIIMTKYTRVHTIFCAHFPILIGLMLHRHVPLEVQAFETHNAVYLIEEIFSSMGRKLGGYHTCEVTKQCKVF